MTGAEAFSRSLIQPKLQPLQTRPSTRFFKTCFLCDLICPYKMITGQIVDFTKQDAEFVDDTHFLPFDGKRANAVWEVWVKVSNDSDQDLDVADLPNLRIKMDDASKLGPGLVFVRNDDPKTSTDIFYRTPNPGEHSIPAHDSAKVRYLLYQHDETAGTALPASAYFESYNDTTADVSFKEGLLRKPANFVRHAPKGSPFPTELVSLL